MLCWRLTQKLREHWPVSSFSPLHIHTHLPTPILACLFLWSLGLGVCGVSIWGVGFNWSLKEVGITLIQYAWVSLGCRIWSERIKLYSDTKGRSRGWGKKEHEFEASLIHRKLKTGTEMVSQHNKTKALVEGRLWYWQLGDLPVKCALTSPVSLEFHHKHCCVPIYRKMFIFDSPMMNQCLLD